MNVSGQVLSVVISPGWTGWGCHSSW